MAEFSALTLFNDAPWMPLEGRYPTTAYGYDGKIHPERPTPSEWRRFHMAHARALGTHTKTEWLELKAEAEWCFGCGSTSSYLTKDHIVPVSRGGCDCIQNIQPLCSSCNSAKGASIWGASI